jgi:hypothetical protein
LGEPRIVVALHGGHEFDGLGERLMALSESFEAFVYVHGRPARSSLSSLPRTPAALSFTDSGSAR